MKRPTNNRTPAAAAPTKLTPITTTTSGSATGDESLICVDRNYQQASQLETSELLPNNNNNNTNSTNLRQNIKSAEALVAARLSRVDDRYQKHRYDLDHLDQQQVSLLDRHRRPNQQDEVDQNSISQLNRQQVQLNNDSDENDNNSKDRTKLFSSSANMFSSSANSNNGSRAGAGKGAGDFSSSNVINDKKTKKNSKVTILGSGGVSLVDNDIEAASKNNGDAADASRSSSSSASFCCGKLKWITLVLMGLILLLAVLLVAILSFSTINKDDQFLNKDSPFHQANSYKLFSTKTLYFIAYNYLSKTATPTILTAPTAASLVVSNNNNNYNDPGSGSGSGSGSNSNNYINNNIFNQNNNLNINNNNNNINYDKSSIYVPNIFSQQDSLESLNRRLTSPENGCQAKQLYFVGRHAARLPSERELERIKKHMDAVQARIDLTSFQTTSSTPPTTVGTSDISDDGVERQQAVPNSNQPMISTTGDNKSGVDTLAQFKNWKLFAEPDNKQGNLLMETGAQETRAIAKRFKSIYPDLFNAKETQIHVGTTKELRTAQTAVNFISQLDNYQIDGCELSQFPAENTADKSRSQEIQNDKCYAQFLKKHTQEKLMFHQKCESLHKSNLTFNHNLNLDDVSRTESIVKSVKQKLKLNKKEDELTSEETKAIYDVCKYETALTGSTSIWCSLFTEKDLRLYEYLSDIDDFFNSAYGHPNQALSACSVTLDMLQTFNKLRKYPDTANAAHFYFTHSQVIQKVLAAAVDLETDPEYSVDTILDHLSRGEAPKNRQWQTSLFTPFSANIAFTLYDCPKKKVASDPNDGGLASTEDSQSLNVANDITLKVVASLNEQPIMLTGCPDYICDFNQLLGNARIAREKSCNLPTICKTHHIFT